MASKKKNTPAEKAPRKQLIGDDLDFAGREAFNVLRTNLTFSIPGKKTGKIIGMTSPCPQEGKSVTSINLAFALAKDGHKTLLISADMRRPAAEQYIGIPAGEGLSNILAGNATEGAELLHEGTLHENLTVMSAGSIPPNPSELLGGEGMKRLLDSFQDMFEFIVIDLPPITSVIDAIAVSKYLDGMLLVIRHGRTRKQNAIAAMNQLRLSGVRVLGFVYNGYRTGGSYYRRYYRGYYRRGYYGRSYGYYGKSYGYYGKGYYGKGYYGSSRSNSNPDQGGKTK